MSKSKKKIKRLKKDFGVVLSDLQHCQEWFDQAVDLIKHIELHSAYARCGYQQMTTKQKKFFKKVLKLPDPETL